MGATPTQEDEGMRTIRTQIFGGPSDGVTYDRPLDQTAGQADDGVWAYLYELDAEGRMVWTGERSPLRLEDLEKEIAEVLGC